MTENIPFGGIIKLREPGFDGLPDIENPYYFTARDGLFLHRRMALGRAVIKQKFMPENWPSFGADHKFIWDAPIIPASLMAQVVDFFHRIYLRQKTEAAVLLTLNEETQEWGVFVPTQLVSHGGVNYVYDPSHIQRPRLVVGSIHSHCDFSPFHSGTDTGDAENFDGFHATVGYIMADTPGIVAMVAANKALMHFNKDTFPELFDYSEVKKGIHAAPAWWDQYVENTVEKILPVGFDLYKKFEKPTLVKEEKKVSTTTTSVTRWVPPVKNASKPTPILHARTPRSEDTLSDEQLARRMMADWGIPGYGFGLYDDDEYDLLPPLFNRRGTKEKGFGDFSPKEMRENGYEWDEDLKTWRWVGGGASHSITRESAMFNAKKMAEQGVKWAKDGSLKLIPDSEDWWEDNLSKEVLDAIFDSGCLTDDDLDWATAGETAPTPEDWTSRFFEKAVGTIHALRTMGMDIQLRVSNTTREGHIQTWLIPQITEAKGDTAP